MKWTHDRERKTIPWILKITVGGASCRTGSRDEPEDPKRRGSVTMTVVRLNVGTSNKRQNLT